MATSRQKLFRELAVAIPVVPVRVPGGTAVDPGKARACIAWARTAAVGISIAFHVLLLAGTMAVVTPPRFALTSSGQKTSASKVEVRLIARSAEPVPRKPEAKARPKAASVEPKRKTTPRHRVLAVKAPASRAITEDSLPDTARAAEAPSTQPLDTASVPPPAAPASVVDPMMSLPGASSIKEVQNVACDIPRPRYPFAARRAGMEGTVWIHATITTTGAIEDARVVQSSGRQELDASARSAILAGHCDPYTENGRGVTVAARLPVNFRLK